MARSFNGTSDKIITPLVTTSVANISMSCWAKATSTPPAGTMFPFYNGSSTSIFNGWGIALQTNGNWEVFASGVNEAAGGAAVAGVWVQLVATRDGTTSRIYTNGVLSGNTFASTPTTPTVGTGMGADGNGGSFFNGSVADCGFWNAALTQGEVTALANGARPYQIRPASLIGYWPVSGLQSPEPDLSGLKNNGTVTGTASAPGPPIMQFTPRWPLNSVPVVAAGPSFQPAWATRNRIIVEGIGI